MGASGSKNEEERKPQINIIKNDSKEKDINNKENERVIPGSTNYFNTDKFDIISK